MLATEKSIGQSKVQNKQPRIQKRNTKLNLPKLEIQSLKSKFNMNCIKVPADRRTGQTV
jgi:hypothetical protein